MPYLVDNFMGNIKRYFETGFSYFVTTVVQERRPIFLDDKMCRILLVSIEYFKLILDYKIYAYCIMPDHLHLILHPIGKYDLSYIMQMIKGSFARKINKMSVSTGKLWQKRYYDEAIRDELMLIRKMEYIHNNPLRSDLVKALEEYKYSSYQFYFNNKCDVLTIDKLIL